MCVEMSDEYKFLTHPNPFLSSPQKLINNNTLLVETPSSVDSSSGRNRSGSTPQSSSSSSTSSASSALSAFHEDEGFPSLERMPNLESVQGTPPSLSPVNRKQSGSRGSVDEVKENG